MSGKPYNKKDFYHQKAKEEGFLARSAYKLQEIQKKFHLIKRGAKVLDLGCAPGAWVQVALPLVSSNGIIVGVDIEKIDLKATKLDVPQFRFMHRDAFTLQPEDLPESPFDVILSDMAPKTSGVKIRDQARSAEMCLLALEVAKRLGKPGSSLVVKLFEGEDANNVRKEIDKSYKTLKIFRPQSTRSASVEVYLIATDKTAN